MITISSLAVGGLLASGGQGDVYELGDASRRLLKRYRRGLAVDVAGLETLVGWQAALPARDGSVIGRHTAWPTHVVDCEDGTFGILMRRAPDAFWHTVEGDRLPRDLSWAFMADAARFVGLQPAAPRTAVRLVSQLAAVYDVLHRNGVVYGDLSASNVLWTGGTSPSILLIDCDAAHVEGAPRALPEAQTPLWNCPWPGVEGRERDEFKLAVAFLRVYFRYEGPLAAGTPAIVLPAHPPVTRAAADLLGSGLQQVSARPQAAEWLPALQRLHDGLRARRVA